MTAFFPTSKAGFVLFLFLLAIAAGVMLSVAHAIEQHGVDGLNAYNCSIGSDNLIQRWQKPDGRQIYVCDVSGKFGIVVEENGDLVTAFVKDKFKLLEQVERYLRNCGASQVW